jgi:osmoprotectant transport system permease protein
VNMLSGAWEWLTDAGTWSGSSGIPTRVQEHLWYSLLAVLIAIGAGLPPAVWLGHRRRFGTAAINLSNIGRAVPSFAILILGAQLWGLSEWAGVPWAALVALVALALPPIVTNGYVAMAEVDDAIRDAARGMGMTGRQSLWRAELPVAVPGVMNGIRIATLQVVATAALAAVLGAGGLGRFIVDGIAVRDFPRVFGGALLVAALALAVEGLLALAQRAATPKGVRLARRPT